MNAHIPHTHGGSRWLTYDRSKHKHKHSHTHTQARRDTNTRRMSRKKTAEVVLCISSHLIENATLEVRSLSLVLTLSLALPCDGVEPVSERGSLRYLQLQYKYNLLLHTRTLLVSTAASCCVRVCVCACALKHAWIVDNI